MPHELKIPEVGESIQEVQIAQWLKREGDSVRADEEVVELESEKASLAIAAPAGGVLKQILKQAGQSAAVGETVGIIDTDGAAKPPAEEKSAPPAKPPAPKQKKQQPPEAEPAQQPPAEPKSPVAKPPAVTPSARRALQMHGLAAEDVPPSGERLRGKDVERFAAQRQPSEQPPEQPPAEPESGGEEIVPLSPIRRRIAQRLVAAQHEAALLTTFNEVEMSAVMQLRKEFGERFRERHGVKLGIMSFFLRATCEALKQTRELNAEIRGSDVVYRRDQHLGIAIGSSRGLVVPVIRRAQTLSFAEVERQIADFARRAEENKLLPDELRGGTFTISNGGIYGSLLSTPIVNPPQSGVLGMHAIEERPVARDGQVVIRQMMYLALTYDHRLVDGREAVTFLRTIKERIEQPARLLLEV
jgi:2-oxoglutarate dehydrogenase E2 component (dihydrolipoamide succinyltransferase)